jgi:hypothetical protein
VEATDNNNDHQAGVTNSMGEGPTGGNTMADKDSFRVKAHRAAAIPEVTIRQGGISLALGMTTGMTNDTQN